MERKEWSRELINQLITDYEANEALWNTRNAEYRDRDKKNKTLQALALKFTCTSNEIQRKLHNLRNQMSQELNKIKKKKSGSGTDENYVSKWPYFSSMKFLIPALTVNATKSNVVINEFEESTSNVNLDNDGNTEIEIVKKSKKVGETSTSSKRQRTENDDEILKNAMEIMKKVPDENDRFGEYVAMELRSLRSDFNRRRLKSEIRKSITRIADEDDILIPSTSSSPMSPPSPAVMLPIGPSPTSFMQTPPYLSSTPLRQIIDESNGTSTAQDFVNAFVMTDL